MSEPATAEGKGVERAGRSQMAGIWGFVSQKAPGEGRLSVTMVYVVIAELVVGWGRVAQAYPGDWLRAGQRHRLEIEVLHPLGLQAILQRRLELS